MTVKRDFKRRVRQRQARTGESYVTARRHLMATRPADDDDLDPAAPAASEATPPGHAGEVLLGGAGRDAGGGRGGADAPGDGGSGDGDGDGDGGGSGGISVVEVVDVTEEARRVGLACRVVMYPSLADRLPPARALRRLREVLIATAGDRAIGRLSRLALTGQVPPQRGRDEMASIDRLRQFLQRARAGLGGTLNDGATLAFHVADGEELVPIMCTLAARDTAIELSIIGGPLPERWTPLASVMTTLRAGGSEALRRRELVEALTGDIAEQLWQLVPRRLPEPALRVVYAGMRHTVTREPFVIGHNAEVCDLVLDDRAVSAEHAAVIVRNGKYFVKAAPARCRRTSRRATSCSSRRGGQVMWIVRTSRVTRQRGRRRSLCYRTDLFAKARISGRRRASSTRGCRSTTSGSTKAMCSRSRATSSASRSSMADRRGHA